MSDWSIDYSAYDYRFGSYSIRMKHGQEMSPVYMIQIREILKQIPASELMAVLKPEYEWTEGAEDINQARIRLLESVDWRGKVCLDVGGYSGEMSKRCLELGANRAIVVDAEQWRHYGWPEIRYPGVEYVKSDLTDWTEPGDVVIAYNILYHTRHPMRMLEHLRRITKPSGEMLLCTLFRYMDGSWVYYYNPRECNKDDETCYFGPSLEALERMLRRTGWIAERYALAYDRCLYRCKPNPIFVEAHPEP